MKINYIARMLFIIQLIIIYHFNLYKIVCLAVSLTDNNNIFPPCRLTALFPCFAHFPQSINRNRQSQHVHIEKSGSLIF